ncbi:acetyltransferase [Pseudomonas sp. PDM14]|uniref:acetyltransferase n=1 Tax=Pseudomonas sp. PDM14 TaxID=2769288 RepID=UPI00177C88CF|nr:acetyltransferase [Pseudomonas sp. PDM14]MBD9484613.1 acetyltransferase [Pseudomonas sp. PDM14]
MKRLAILGASGHGKVVADTAELCGWQRLSFFDDAWPTLLHNGEWAVEGNTAALLESLSDFDGVLVAIGQNDVRLAKVLELQAAGARIATLIHPLACISRYASLREGCVVFAGAVVNAYAKVGTATIINTGSSVDHDCELAAAVHISPGAHLAGGVQVGEATWIGIGACVRQSIRIGRGVMIGAGAAVVADIPDGYTAVGVPARLVQL